ncbi:hypothetical protein BKI52_07695 [marine bacterium AO1-C]|nr:hypothetical protein BKI52_07695 [marine bacterium AO1-C]
MGDIASDDDKWQKAFKNYLSYALSEQQNIKVEWKNISDLIESVLPSSTPIFILGTYSNQNLQNQDWLTNITKLWEWSEGQNQAYFYKILRESLNANNIPDNSDNARKFDLCVYDPKSGELVPEETLLSEKINLFLPKVFLLTREIATQTRAFYKAQSFPEAKAPTAPSTEKPTPKNIVFLAQVSPQSARLREKLRQELVSQGFQVLPTVNYSFQDETELVQAIRKDLKKSNLIIHLFGEEIDTRRDGVNDTIEAIQNKTAAKYFLELLEDDQKIVKRMIWIADINKIKNQQYKRFITNLKLERELHFGGDIYQSTIEELKDIILGKLKVVKPKRKTKIDLSKDVILEQVYVINDIGTEDDLCLMKEFLAERDYRAVYLNNPVSQSEAQAQHEAFLFRSSGIIIIHNEHNIHWIRAKINSIFKVRSKGRKEAYQFKIVLSRTLTQLPNEPIYNDIQLVHPENIGELDFFGNRVLEKAE